MGPKQATQARRGVAFASAAAVLFGASTPGRESRCDFLSLLFGSKVSRFNRIEPRAPCGHEHLHVDDAHNFQRFASRGARKPGLRHPRLRPFGGMTVHRTVILVRLTLRFATGASSGGFGPARPATGYIRGVFTETVSKHTA